MPPEPRSPAGARTEPPSEPASEPKPELSRPFAVAELDDAPRPFAVEATAEERAALARRFDLESIEALTAALTVRRAAEPGGAEVHVDGTLDAAVVQRCVVTLEPVPATLRQPFAARFAPRAALDGEPIDLDLEGEADPVEPFDGRAIDLGELVAQQLSLALDPYPRAPGASFAEPEAAGTARSPFAALKRLTPGPDS